jgi:DNA-directed RNA polymerase III subunit RPC3
MPLKEVRMHLAHLQSMSLIETSEIPKNPGLKKQTMTAASEHHHWGIDLPRAYNVLVASVYKTLGNILQRRSSEKERRKAALAREQQAFARGLDRSVMTAKDQEDLADLDDVVRKLALAEARCEMVVFILRDLPGWPTRKAIG